MMMDVMGSVERVEDGHSTVLWLNRDEKSYSRGCVMMMDVSGSVWKMAILLCYGLIEMRKAIAGDML